jgi:hypothetical protein
VGGWSKALRSAAVVIAAAAVLPACTSESRPADESARTQEPLSATTLRTYGFESLSDWSAIFSTPTLSLSSTRVQGSWSLSVAGGGWASFRSRAIVKEDPAPTVVGFDLRIPSPQPNPSWFGTVILFVSIPSQGINEMPLGNHDLITWTPGQWKRAEFTLPTNVRNALNANFNDLRWRVELNRPTDATAGYLFDRFTFCNPQNDNNPCTTDICNNGQQLHVPVPSGTSCADSNICNGGETCNATGTCVAGTPVTCTAMSQCHNVGTCNTATGVCSTPAKSNGTACSDANACTQADTCQSGTCVAGAPVVCMAMSQCHNVGTCNTSTGVCSNPIKPDGSGCSDNNACTQMDTCTAGACTSGAPVVCTAQSQCHNVGSCNPSTGVCSNPTKPDGSGCTDSNACTQMDTCQAGVCASGTPVVCTAQSQCHNVGACNPSTGVCSNPIRPDGSGCSDGNACTQVDMCLSGMCTGNAVVCTASDQCHDAGTCNPSTGACSNPAKPNGSACSDANVCTQTDTCQSGACAGSNPVDPSDSNPCTADTCDPVGGVSHTPLPEGTNCTLTGGSLGMCDGAGTCNPRTPGDCNRDGIRHPTEECDDGAGNEPDLCTVSCRVSDALAVRGTAGGESRYLGESRHPVSAGPRGFAASFVELDSEPPVVGLAVFDSAGDPRSRLAVSSGSTPLLFSSPAVAALDDGSYAVAWTDFGRDGDELGVALRRVRPTAASGSSPPVSGADLGASLSTLQFANGTTEFSQYDADILRVGNQLVVSWIDTSNAPTAPDVRYRVFEVGSSGSQSTFRAIGAEQDLADTQAFEGNVALAPFGQTWVAAWRASLATGEETIEVALPSEGLSWSLGPELPGAPEDRPAIAELDAEHLAVLYSVGTDPEETSVANVSRLRLAVLSLSEAEPVAIFDFLADADEYQDLAIAQSHPSLVRAGSVLYAAWHTASLIANVEAENVFLRALTWDVDDGLFAEAEIRIPRTPAGSIGDQRFPALAVGPQQIGSPGLPGPAPQGSLVIAWDDYGRQFGTTTQGGPDVLVQFWPLPVLRIDGLAFAEEGP